MEYAGTVYEETENEIIENMQLAGQAYDSIHSNTNKVSDKVLNTAMNYHREERHINKEDRQFLQTKLEELTKLKDELEKNSKSWKYDKSTISRRKVCYKDILYGKI